MSILNIENVALRFGGLTAVKDLSLTIEPGQIFALIGPNGAGKTSVFNVITGIYPPSEGNVLLQGKDAKRAFSIKTVAMLSTAAILCGIGLVIAINIEALWEAAITSNYVYQQPFPWSKALHDTVLLVKALPALYTFLPLVLGAFIGLWGSALVWHRSRRTPDVIAEHPIARTFQNIRLFGEMTTLQNVLVGMDTKLETGMLHAALRLPLFRRENQVSTEKACALLSFVGLEDELHCRASALSYGHQRRLEIARALAKDPKLLLLDEPAAGMNPSESHDLMELIKKIRDRGVTVLLIEHDMKVVMGISDRIVVLDYGSKIAEGTPAEVRADRKVIAAYLGEEK